LALLLNICGKEPSYCIFTTLKYSSILSKFIAKTPKTFQLLLNENNPFRSTQMTSHVIATSFTKKHKRFATVFLEGWINLWFNSDGWCFKILTSFLSNLRACLQTKNPSWVIAH